MIRLYLSNDTSANAAGAERLARAWSSHPDVELIRTSSRGAFFLEPLVERDTQLGRMAWPLARPDDLPRILAGEGGTPVEQIPFLARQTRVTFANFGLTRPLSLEEYVAHGGGVGLDRARSLSPEEIITELQRSQLRGRGGAAFPVWTKWKIARETPADRKYVVANADEGDAGTYCDRMLMEGEPFRLIEGMLICALAIGAERGYIYCRHEYPAAARTLKAAIEEAEQSGMLDIAGKTFKLEVFVGAGSYVCGEETALLESLEGRRGVVRPKPPYPAVAGLYGRPTFVSNVLTLLDIPICYDAFADAGAILGHGGIVVFDDSTDMAELAHHFMAFTADESCGAGTPCRLGSVRAREILDRLRRGHGGPDDLALLADLGETMKAASLCALGARAPYPVLTAIEHFRTEFVRGGRDEREEPA
jgi:formate dehydrogenase iron-sulfur subunit